MKEFIDDVIQDLIDDQSNLESTLLKCQVLAYKLKNEKFKTWVNWEMNGYPDQSNIPEYRCIPCGVKGHMFMDLGFGGSKQLPDTVLPIQYLEEEYQKNVSQQKFGERISQLQEFAKSQEGLIGELPHSFLQRISRFTGHFEVIKARKIIPPGAVTGIISSIKSKLMTFLLELKEELGDEEIPQMTKNKAIDQLMEKTIGAIRAENVNISFGEKGIQSNNSGGKNKSKNVTGDNVQHGLNLQDITTLIENIKNDLNSTVLTKENEITLLDQTTRIEEQLSKAKPSKKILKKSLEVIYDLATEVAGSAISEPIINTITQTIKGLGM